MAFLTVIVVLAALAGQSQAARPIDDEERGQLRAPAPPQWPDVYEMEYSLILPYVQTMQPGGLRYPIHVWWDGPGQRYRFDVYGGMDSLGWDINEGINWSLYPRITELACDYSNSTTGPTAQRQQLLQQLGLGLGEGESPTPLPDITGWSYAGTAQVRNADALVWQLSHRLGEKTATYTFYTAHNGWPLRFDMMGINLMTGSHFDEYVVEFTRFKPGPVAAAAFALPSACQGQEARLAGAGAAGVAARLGALLPAARLGAAHPYAALDELRASSASALEANARLVDEHNRRNRDLAAAAPGAAAVATYRLSLNHFAPLTHQQWTASLLGLAPRAARPRRAAAPAGRPYQRVLRDDQLPASVDWRGTGADGPGVKDQVSCGSCWAFSAVGAMQGAWFKATGQSLSFSEQQLVDCAWDYDNNGCAGGYVEPAIQYVVDAGGVAQEADYPYMAQNAFCRGPTLPSALSGPAGRREPPAPLTGRFTGFLNVPARDEGALMEAVALHGPVAVLMNAGLLPFKFYSEGVYHNEECSEDPDHMDHAILLVGYGTTPEGVDYWLIKNSWSKFWGMDGYARISRKGNDCGITTDPVLAVAVATATTAAATTAVTAAE